MLVVRQSLHEASYVRKPLMELMLSGVADQEAIRILVDALGNHEVSESPARYVAFAPLREEQRDYLSELSSNTRYRVRRTQQSMGSPRRRGLFHFGEVHKLSPESDSATLSDSHAV